MRVGKEATRQIDLFARFRPTPSQLRFLKSDAFGRLMSSGYGSGKSKLGCREAIRWAVSIPGSRGMIGRLTATDLRDTTMVTFWREINQIGFKRAETEADLEKGRGHWQYNKADKILKFWNGSEIAFRHLDDPDALGSLELTWAFIDEGAEVADAIYQTLSSSRMRWHVDTCDQQEQVEAAIARGATDEEIAQIPCDCKRGIWVCTNPGASGYLKSVTRGLVPDWEWIPARPGDNPYNGPDYYAKMERDRKINGDTWMKRFYEGSWDAFEGQRFPMFDRETHVLKEGWRPTERHTVVEGWDFGHRETFVTWMAYLPDRSEPVVVFHELQMNEVQEPKEVADEVKRIRGLYGLQNPMALGDPAGVAASTFSAVSPIQAYAGLGVYIAPCKKGKSPQGRADLLTAFLNERKKMPDGSSWPGIMFSPTCPAVIDSIINLRWKPQTGKLGEDPREVFLKKDDHGFDALGYGLVGVPPPDLPAPERKLRMSMNIGANEAFRAG
jgi:hypothetical protein